MRGLIIAAGPGSRMGRLTEVRPKCLLPIAGSTLLEHTIDELREVGCNKIVVIVGYKAEMIAVPDVTYVRNDDYLSNNILHSLMKAREYLVGPVVVSYSDIWVEPAIYESVMQAPGDIVLAVDRDWQPYYEGRTDHLVSEAENVYYRADGSVMRIGKHLDADAPDGLACGEFLGLWRMTEEGTARFSTAFAEVDARLDADDPFQHAAHWRRAYITDMVQEMVDGGERVNCAVVERGWAELDTPQDYGRLVDIAQRQRLVTILRSGAKL